jgi:hypothetical protein
VGRERVDPKDADPFMDETRKKGKTTQQRPGMDLGNAGLEKAKGGHDMSDMTLRKHKQSREQGADVNEDVLDLNSAPGPHLAIVPRGRWQAKGLHERVDDQGALFENEDMAKK